MHTKVKVAQVHKNNINKSQIRELAKQLDENRLGLGMPYRIFVQGTVYCCSSDFVACPDFAAHFSTTQKCLSQRSEPIIVTTSKLVVGCTEALEGGKYEISDGTVFPMS